jgi:hypothetical protein
MGTDRRKVDPSTGNLGGTHPYVTDPKTGERKFVLNALPDHWAHMDSYIADSKTGERTLVMKALPAGWAKMETRFADSETGEMKLGPPFMPCGPIPKSLFC